MRSRVLDSAFHGQWHALLMVVVFSVVFNLLMLTAPLFMLAVFSNVMTSKNEDTLVLLSVAAAVALLFLCWWWFPSDPYRLRIPFPGRLVASRTSLGCEAWTQLVNVAWRGL